MGQLVEPDGKIWGKTCCELPYPDDPENNMETRVTKGSLFRCDHGHIWRSTGSHWQYLSGMRSLLAAKRIDKAYNRRKQVSLNEGVWVDFEWNNPTHWRREKRLVEDAR